MRKVDERTYATESMVASLLYGIVIGVFSHAAVRSRSIVSGLIAAGFAAVVVLAIIMWRNDFPGDEMIEIGSDNTGGENE
ncbi:hypothetical protein [Natrinema sp. H-ect4]|uniref:hypothetical protein n=1 Tax=Natrinema sp. H-ect4 TaxID=3242699 RepID=UPI0035A819B0